MNQNQIECLISNIRKLKNLTVEIPNNDDELCEFLESLNLNESNNQMMLAIQTLINDTLKSFLEITDNIKHLLTLVYYQSQIVSKARQEGE